MIAGRGSGDDWKPEPADALLIPIEIWPAVAAAISAVLAGTSERSEAEKRRRVLNGLYEAGVRGDTEAASEFLRRTTEPDLALLDLAERCRPPS